MAKRPKVLGLTLYQKLTYRTHIHNISVQTHKPLQMIKALTTTGWGKQKDMLMATYNAVMRPALENASSIWAPLASSTSINKLQVMQHWDYHRMHTRHKHTSHTRAPTVRRVTIQTKNTTSITPLTQTYNIRQHSKAKTLYFNTGCYTTNIPTYPHTITTTYIKTNMCHIHTSIVYIQLATRGNN